MPPGSGCAFKIGGERANDSSVDAAVVEEIVLDNYVRMAISGTRTGGPGQRNPENIRLMDHH